MRMFVTDTMIIDKRDGSFIQAGDPIPQDAMHASTLSILYNRGDVLDYSEVNSYTMNPKRVAREQVQAMAGLTGQGVSPPPPQPNSMKDLVRMEAGLAPKDPAHVESGPRKLVVPVSGAPETETITQLPQPPAPLATPLIEKVWIFDPVVLEPLDIPVLMNMMTERCGQYNLRVPVAAEFQDRQALIKFMTQEYPVT